MICELCGKTCNEGFRIKLEGGLVCACKECSTLGERVSAVRQAPKPKPNAQSPAVLEQDEALAPKEEEVGFDIVDDFGGKVKAAREKRGWTQEELGKMVNEPHSLIHRIELGKFEPTEGLARVLESRLGVRLLIPHEEGEETSSKKDSREVTLGDLVVIRRRSK